jgi:DMSO/TMAO reductase YedYZ heme-binding membrane subunit
VVACGILGCCYLLNIIDQDGLKDTGAKVLGLIGILAVVALAVSALTSSRNDS